MVTHVSHVVRDLPEFRSALEAMAATDEARRARSVLVQIYCGELDGARHADLLADVAAVLPGAVVVGATTVGEIAAGRSLAGETVVGVTFFARSVVTPLAISCRPGDEHAAGEDLGRRILGYGGSIAGVLLLATPLSIDMSLLLAGMEASGCDRPVFGGGAGDYAAMASSTVFCGDDILPMGAVAVLLEGDDLRLEIQTYLGWRPLSRRMRIGETDGLVVRTVDSKPASEVYKRYLGVRGGDDFFLNALEFPFLLERDGKVMARVPIAVTEEGGLQFVADVQAGEDFRIGYGHPDIIIENAREVHRAMSDFGAEAIFLYSCGCRRFLMQQDVELEVAPFEAVAPTLGFYTYGEFCGAGNVDLLNSTMVAVGLRESHAAQGTPLPDKPTGMDEGEDPRLDPYLNKHTRIISRLMTFIEAVTSELEISNREIVRLSMLDKLTQLPNRARLDEILDENIDVAMRHGSPLSIILLDIDHFKQVNDVHGHLAGDAVLNQVGSVLAASTRSSDSVGRWGGEEFLIILPLTPLEPARIFAEKLRARVAAEQFATVGRKTISLGVAAYSSGDDRDTLLRRADAALYQAKSAGRNRVATEAPPSGRV